MQEAQEWSEKGGSDEYHDRVRTKFDQESASRHKPPVGHTRQSMPRNGTWCGGEFLGGSGLNMDNTCEQQGTDEECGLQPPEQLQKQRRRDGEKMRPESETSAHCM